MTIIANRTSRNIQRWVDLRDDGTAVACTVGTPMNVSMVDGRQKVTRLPARTIERPIQFKDQDDLRRIAHNFVRTGAVETAWSPAEPTAAEPTPEAPGEGSGSADVPGE